MSGACPVESHLPCPQLGRRGRAGRGRDWSTAEPRPSRPPDSDPTFSPAGAPPPSAALRSALSPRAEPPAPAARAAALSPAPRALPAPYLAHPRTRPARPARPPGKMRLLPEWLLLLFGPWLLRKVRVAKPRRGVPNTKNLVCQGARCVRPAPSTKRPNFVRPDRQTAGFRTGTRPAQVG